MLHPTHSFFTIVIHTALVAFASLFVFECRAHARISPPINKQKIEVISDDALFTLFQLLPGAQNADVMYDILETAVVSGMRRKGDVGRVTKSTLVKRMADFKYYFAKETFPDIVVKSMRKSVTERQAVDLMKFFTSTTGRKWLEYQAVFDSLGEAEAQKRVSYTMSELREQSDFLEHGAGKDLQKIVTDVFAGVGDGFQAYARDFTDKLSNRLQNLDVFLFRFGLTDTAESRVQRVSRVLGEVASTYGGSTGKSPEESLSPEDIQRMLRVSDAVRLNNPNPCDTFLLPWGASESDLRKAAKSLGLELLSDSTYFDKRVLQYTYGISFFVSEKHGYERLILSTKEDLVSILRDNRLLSSSVSDQWSVIDVDSFSGYGRCNMNNQDRWVIRARLIDKGIVREFFEAIPLSE